MDLVLTWVDGAWPGYHETLRRYQSQPVDLNPNRYRDNIDSLKYALRSVEKHAPWLQRVFLVTARPQVPAWLNTAAADLRVIHHDEFIPKVALPTFSSFGIVCHLTRIPGISERFVYLEDDRYFGRPVKRDDFVDTEGRVLLYGTWPPSDAAHRAMRANLNPWNRALALSNHLLDQGFGRTSRRSLKYAPVVFDTRMWQHFESKFAAAIATTTANRFRNAGSIAPEHMFPHFLWHTNRARYVGLGQAHHACSYLGMSNSVLLQRLGLRRLRTRRTKFVCMNDNFGDTPRPACVTMARDFLETQFPEPSRFEITP